MAPYTLSRISDRLAWSAAKNSYALLLEQKRQAGARLLDLTIANPTQALPGYPHKDIALAYGAIATFCYEPEPFGTPAARQTVADWYASQNLPVHTDRIALTASTSEAYSLLFKLLCDPGDEILIPSPSYPLFEYLARAESVKAKPYQLLYDGSWFIDFATIQKAISPRTKAIVMVNPNNPTGSFLKVHEALQLISIAEEHALALISDEVFMSYPAVGSCDADKVRSLIAHDQVLSFSLNGLSKAAGMPQMKLGWIVVNGPPKDLASMLPKMELLLDSYLSVATPVQSALPQLLQIGQGIQRQISARLQQNRQTLRELKDTSIEPLASEGGWSAILQVPNVHSEEHWITALLNECGVIVQPGYFYDMAREAFLVVSLLAHPVDFAEGIDTIKRLALHH